MKAFILTLSNVLLVALIMYLIAGDAEKAIIFGGLTTWGAILQEWHRYNLK